MALGSTFRRQNQDLFDHYAARYQEVLNRALTPSGEGGEYFARGRVQWLKKQLDRLGLSAASVLDYGCGTGGSVPFLCEILGCRRVLGVDISPESVRLARERHGGKGIEFENCDVFFPHSEFELAFSNGVFHHIDPGERPLALRYIYNSLAANGIFALWENNPWNPATRYIMGKCELDEEAVSISSRESCKLLYACGFQIVHSSTFFYFPRWLKWLRKAEPALAHLPFGAQYLLLARKVR